MFWLLFLKVCTDRTKRVWMLSTAVVATDGRIAEVVDAVKVDWPSNITAGIAPMYPDC